MIRVTLILLACFMLLLGCKTSVQKVYQKENTTLVEYVLENDFEVLDDKRIISSRLVKKLNKGKSDFDKLVFGNPDELVNLTDLYSGEMPNTQIIELGKSENVIYILYDKGGFGITRNCLIYKKIDNKSFEVFFPDIPPNINNIFELKKYLKLN